MATEKHWKVSRARDRVMRDLIRQQNAPVPENEVTQLYLEINAEIARLGLPESDAAWFYKKMQRDGWKLEGIPIDNWRFTVASMHRHKYFLSQR